MRSKAIIFDATSWFVRGECYRNGFGFKMNKHLAAAYYKTAVKHLVGIEANIASYETLGQMYETGDGVRENYRQSSKYFSCAANKLSKLGQWKTAIAFEKGLGQEKEVQRAVYFSNCVQPQEMHKYYLQGHGVERSRAQTRKVRDKAGKEQKLG